MSTTLRITPTRFIASNGKLDSNFRYIFRVSAGQEFLFPIGRTLDLPNRGIVYNMAGVQRITGTSSSFTATTIPMRS
jgi:hypothetical protein